MFAVIKTGGKQFRVAAGDTITIPKLALEAGDKVTFDEVLMLTREGGVEVGAPGVSGASVSGEIVEQARGPKVIAFKKRRRKNSRRKRGHRQDLTIVRIGAIALNGETIAEAKAPVRTAKPADPAPAEAEA
ncbi:50S ribosomal protein L21 [Enterovirga rhinocerotis]|uniref:Large ribosomal subunit protein bL21 n=1 Tax=Enterovirga rhinocerotis TaxID=1339210 RepID=A0A4R7BRF5_9HYPH|nr:50S ribosomal protein L21 [Enterovirga rhinocerotis]TDR88260.1 LSU ribosomal protein L21P [Enterovirga rhinocerotis]